MAMLRGTIGRRLLDQDEGELAKAPKSMKDDENVGSNEEKNPSGGDYDDDGTANKITYAQKLQERYSNMTSPAIKEAEQVHGGAATKNGEEVEASELEDGSTVAKSTKDESTSGEKDKVTKTVSSDGGENSKDSTVGQVKESANGDGAHVVESARDEDDAVPVAEAVDEVIIQAEESEMHDDEVVESARDEDDAVLAAEAVAEGKMQVKHSAMNDDEAVESARDEDDAVEATKTVDEGKMQVKESARDEDDAVPAAEAVAEGAMQAGAANNDDDEMVGSAIDEDDLVTSEAEAVAKKEMQVKGAAGADDEPARDEGDAVAETAVGKKMSNSTISQVKEVKSVDVAETIGDTTVDVDITENEVSLSAPTAKDEGNKEATDDEVVGVAESSKETFTMKDEDGEVETSGSKEGSELDGDAREDTNEGDGAVTEALSGDQADEAASFSSDPGWMEKKVKEPVIDGVDEVSESTKGEVKEPDDEVWESTNQNVTAAVDQSKEKPNDAMSATTKDEDDVVTVTPGDETVSLEAAPTKGAVKESTDEDDDILPETADAGNDLNMDVGNEESTTQVNFSTDSNSSDKAVPSISNDAFSFNNAECQDQSDFIYDSRKLRVLSLETVGDNEDGSTGLKNSTESNVDGSLVATFTKSSHAPESNKGLMDCRQVIDEHPELCLEVIHLHVHKGEDSREKDDGTPILEKETSHTGAGVIGGSNATESKTLTDSKSPSAESNNDDDGVAENNEERRARDTTDGNIEEEAHPSKLSNAPQSENEILVTFGSLYCPVSCNAVAQCEVARDHFAGANHGKVMDAVPDSVILDGTEASAKETEGTVGTVFADKVTEKNKASETPSCKDDPTFLYKDQEGYDCDYIKANKPEKCLKEHNEQLIGVVFCPVSCDMVEECKSSKLKEENGVKTGVSTEENGTEKGEVTESTASESPTGTEELTKATAPSSTESEAIDDEEEISKPNDESFSADERDDSGKPSVCRDDPTFLYKDQEGYDCHYIKENKPEKCMKEHNGQIIGVVACPVSCGMMDECQASLTEDEVVKTGIDKVSVSQASETEASKATTPSSIESESSKAAVGVEQEISKPTPSDAELFLDESNGSGKLYFCRDDPAFLYKDLEGYDCHYIKSNKPEKCMKEHDGQIIGVVACPVSCGMIDECQKAFANAGEVKEEDIAEGVSTAKEVNGTEIVKDMNSEIFGGAGAESSSSTFEAVSNTTSAASFAPIENVDSSAGGEKPSSISCNDDPTFLYKDKEGYTCKYIGSYKIDKCDKMHNGILIGISSCPESCGMVDKCLQVASSDVASASSSGAIAPVRDPCKDLVTFRLNGDPDKDCSWISLNERCELEHEESGNMIGSYYCPEACGLLEASCFVSVSEDVSLSNGGDDDSRSSPEDVTTQDAEGMNIAGSGSESGFQNVTEKVGTQTLSEEAEMGVYGTNRGFNSTVESGETVVGNVDQKWEVLDQGTQTQFDDDGVTGQEPGDETGNVGTSWTGARMGDDAVDTSTLEFKSSEQFDNANPYGQSFNSETEYQDDDYERYNDNYGGGNVYSYEDETNYDKSFVKENPEWNGSGNVNNEPSSASWNSGGQEYGQQYGDVYNEQPSASWNNGGQEYGQVGNVYNEPTSASWNNGGKEYGQVGNVYNEPTSAWNNGGQEYGQVGEPENWNPNTGYQQGNPASLPAETWDDEDDGFPVGMLLLFFILLAGVLYSRKNRQASSSQGGYQRVEPVDRSMYVSKRR